MCLSELFDQIWIQVWATIFLLDFGRYLIVAGAIFTLLWGLLRKRLAHRRIQVGFPPVRQIQSEIWFSLLTTMIFGGIGMASYLGGQAGILQRISAFEDGNAGYVLVTLLAMIIGHDAYFYWMHRLMHHPRLFKWMHLRHHRSRKPTPWTAYSFAPAEAVIEGLFTPLFMLIVPTHQVTILIWVTHQIIRNAVGHSGFEIFPRGWVDNRWLGWITTVTHHDLHHNDVQGNYGLYFTWWDRWMGTENPDYRQKFREVTGREAEGSS